MQISGHIVHFRNDLLVSGSRNLRAILPITLVTVVLRRVMTGRDHDTGDTAQLPQCKGQFRCGTQRIKHISPDPVGRQTKRRLVRK